MEIPRLLSHAHMQQAHFASAPSGTRFMERLEQECRPDHADPATAAPLALAPWDLQPMMLKQPDVHSLDEIHCVVSLVSITLDGQGAAYAWEGGLLPASVCAMYPNLQQLTLQHCTLVQQLPQTLIPRPKRAPAPALPKLTHLQVTNVALVPKSLVWEVAEATLTASPSISSVAIQDSDMVTAFLWRMTRPIPLTELALQGSRDSHRLIKRLHMWAQGPTGPGHELYPELTSLSLACNLSGEDLCLLLQAAPRLTHLSLLGVFPMATSLALTELPTELQVLHVQELDLQLLTTLPVSLVPSLQCSKCRLRLTCQGATDNVPALQDALQVAAKCGGLKLDNLQATLHYQQESLPLLPTLLHTFVELVAGVAGANAQFTDIVWHYGDAQTEYQHALQHHNKGAVAGLLSKVINCLRLSNRTRLAPVGELHMEASMVCNKNDDQLRH